ncbi:MAG: hypothetical protein KatS3mg084_0124 [Candidatus Dojkabacteria bacterium]|nr:MAG: hypothetical protein KatS3mg084_0124 [Candidatus Dojkabacteria bacterium]
MSFIKSRIMDSKFNFDRLFYLLYVLAGLLVATGLILTVNFFPYSKSVFYQRNVQSYSVYPTIELVWTDVKEFNYPFVYYAWIPHFDFMRGLSSASNYRHLIEEVHFAGASVGSSGDLILSSNFDYALNTLNQNNLKFGVNILSTNPLHTRAILKKDFKYLFDFAIKIKNQYQFFSTLNLNFERVFKEDIALFLEVISQLNEQLEKYNINLFVSVFARSLNSNIHNLTLDNIENLIHLVKVVDRLVLLFYDYALYNGGIGNTPMYWLKDTLETISYEQRAKLIVGLPLYAYEFDDKYEVIRAYTYQELNDKFDLTKAVVDQERDEMFLQNGNNKIYFLDKNRLVNRKNLSKQFGIYAFFYWRLGGDLGVGFE